MTVRVHEGLVEALARAAAVLHEPPSALVTDIDGTISAIVPRPEDATVDPAIARSLERLLPLVALVAVVTARPAATARALVGATGITYVGHYGRDDESAALDEGPARIKDALREIALSLPGATFEDKGVTFSLHYRNTADPDAAREALRARVLPLAARAGTRVIEGKRVIELVPRDLPAKPDAVRRLAAAHRLRGIVYLGDDVSDAGVFRLLRERREAGLPALSIAVVDEETDPQVIETADLQLEGVPAVRDFLQHLPAALDAFLAS
jgi:trehalose 6-phosphate phosphatase